MHLTALRALGGGSYPVGLKVISEGSEEQGLDELEQFVPDNAAMLRADTILICDTGNFAVGSPNADDNSSWSLQHRGHGQDPEHADALGHVRRPGSGRTDRPDHDPRQPCTTIEATSPSGASKTSRSGRVSSTTKPSSARTPTCATASSWLATGRSPTCSGRGLPSPCSASTVRVSLGRQAWSRRRRLPR